MGNGTRAGRGGHTTTRDTPKPHGRALVRFRDLGLALDSRWDGAEPASTGVSGMGVSGTPTLQDGVKKKKKKKISTIKLKKKLNSCFLPILCSFQYQGGEETDTTRWGTHSASQIIKIQMLKVSYIKIYKCKNIYRERERESGKISWRNRHTHRLPPCRAFSFFFLKKNPKVKTPSPFTVWLGFATDGSAPGGSLVWIRGVPQLQ